MRPCDCKSVHETLHELNETGIAFNDFSFTVIPNVVVFKSSDYQIRMPMSVSKRFAEWYLADQEKEA